MFSKNQKKELVISSEFLCNKEIKKIAQGHVLSPVKPMQQFK